MRTYTYILLPTLGLLNWGISAAQAYPPSDTSVAGLSEPLAPRHVSPYRFAKCGGPHSHPHSRQIHNADYSPGSPPNLNSNPSEGASPPTSTPASSSSNQQGEHGSGRMIQKRRTIFEPIEDRNERPVGIDTPLRRQVSPPGLPVQLPTPPSAPSTPSPPSPPSPPSAPANSTNGEHGKRQLPSGLPIPGLPSAPSPPSAPSAPSAPSNSTNSGHGTRQLPAGLPLPIPAAPSAPSPPSAPSAPSAPSPPSNSTNSGHTRRQPPAGLPIRPPTPPSAPAPPSAPSAPKSSELGKRQLPAFPALPSAPSPPSAPSNATKST